jgi:hypothetical protein
MCDYRRGFGLVDTLIDFLQVVTTNNYNTIAFSHFKFYYNTQSGVLSKVTCRFLVTALTMAIPLPPAQVLSSQTPVQN